MIIEAYGLRLCSITRSDLELIRLNRNRQDIRSKMLHQKIISKEQQIKWFKSIDNFNNFYFLIKKDNVPLGLVNGRDIDYQQGKSEGGIFLWEKPSLTENVAFLSSVIMLELTFEFLKLKFTQARVRKDNFSQLKYNIFLGFRKNFENEDSDYILLEMTRSDYQAKRAQLLKYAGMLTEGKKEVTWQSMQLSDTERTFFQNRRLLESHS